MHPPIQSILSFSSALLERGEENQKLEESKDNRSTKEEVKKKKLPVLMTFGIGSISSSITKGSGLGKTCTSAVRWPHLRTAWKGVYARSISFLEYDGYLL